MAASTEGSFGFGGATVLLGASAAADGLDLLVSALAGADRGGRAAIFGAAIGTAAAVAGSLRPAGVEVSAARAVGLVDGTSPSASWFDQFAWAIHPPTPNIAPTNTSTGKGRRFHELFDATYRRITSPNATQR